MLPSSNQFYLYHKPMDMRKGINGLSLLISSDLLLNPGDGSAFIFYNRNLDKLKLLFWDRNGFVLYYKTLSKEKFKIPKLIKLRSLNYEEMRWLFDGLNIEKIIGFKSIKYRKYF